MKINPMSLANVTLSAEMAKDRPIKEDCTIEMPMREVVLQLAMDKPLWQFIGIRAFGSNIIEFKVYQDGEELGTIERTWYRGEYVTEIANKRISSKRERGGGYRTKKPDKAVSEAKKMFMRRSASEIIEDAVQAMSKVVNAQIRERDYETRRLNNSIDMAMLAFVKDTPEGMGAFQQFIAEIPSAKSVRDNIAKLEEVTVENTFIRKLCNLKDVTLVIRADRGYLMRGGGDVKYVTDEELDMDLRGKLGMLKLVEPEHFIEGAGVRVNETVFALFTEGVSDDM